MMKKLNSALLLLTLFCVFHLSNAQHDSKSYAFKDFQKVEIENINGEVEIEIGPSYSLTVSGKGNAYTQVEITQSGDKLKVQFDNKRTLDWRENKVVNVKIVMPKLLGLQNFSNADVRIQKFEGKHFSIENKGNGNVSVSGSTVDHLELNNKGNGNLETKNIFSKKASISKSGNGDVTLKTDSDFTVEMDGNGDIVNYGKGNAVLKKQRGTGKVIMRN